MRIIAPLIVLALVAATPALADTPESCAGTTVQKVSLSRDRTKFSVRGSILAAGGFPSVTGGISGDVTLTLAFEPEADPANVVFSATIAGSAFTPISGGVRYEKKNPGADGIIRVLIRDSRDGTRRLVVKRKGAPIPGMTHAGRLRFVLTAAGGCARTCGSPCEIRGGNRLKCVRNVETVLCGVKSGCELLNVTDNDYSGRACLLPYPSSFYLQDDATTETGKRVVYPREALPKNNTGVHIDPAPYRALDGFSAGPVLTAYWKQGVDLAASNIPPHTDFGASLDPASPTVLIEASSPGCVRVEHFGENDVSLNASAVALTPPNQVFMIRPGRRLKNGTRYIVALRGLVGQDALPIQPGTAFRALRDGTPSGSSDVEARRAAFDGIFAKLENDCGVARSGLTLAWDFTTASDDSVERWLLHMRDETFAALPGSAAPAFVVSDVVDNPFVGDTRVCRRIDGTFTAPLWTTFDGPGSLLNINPVTNLPEQNGTTQVPFRAFIPCSLITPTPTAGRPIFYGHGLLGSRNEVTAGNLRTLANTYGFVMAATDWTGFADGDFGTVVGLVTELSGFPKLSERLHQGVLHQLLLARLLKSPAGFASDPAFQEGGTPLIDTSEVYWYGISQGGIEGGVVMALSQDATRGVLGVPAANYSTLLHRSRDFETFFVVLRASYPDDVQRNLTLALIQQLWDKSEPNGWYHHTLPGTLPNTPAHKVLVHMATSDDEVANLGTQIMVRTMGMPQVSPVVSSYYGIPELAAPFDGSAMVESDGHYGPVPLTNTPPADNSAHGDMRGRPAIQAQIDQFLRPAGDVQNFCVGPCDPQ